ncbi:UNVERIFIED_CONTAM: Retrovirus-related Pol polyprotein from transposon RE2 [Sesamum latifolium]|uniref:Retrovirus-related Pol polyprotein from transposon RE2 n=1 Tax=Sesamum latifolium TaxID=2727402 RepID=A0AAW2YB75_9LAMI
MTNEIQKQYDRLEDVFSIMLRMKDVYVVSDRHIRYDAFFGTKMAEGSFVHSHGVKMLSLVEKLDDLEVGLNNDIYIDVILQSLPPSYDPFIVNYNMNRLEKRGFDLQSKGKGARRWKKKKGKGTAVTAIASTGGAPPAAPKGKGKAKVGVLSGRRQMMCACIAKERELEEGVSTTPLQPSMFAVEVSMISNSASWVLDTGYGAHICNDLQVLERSRRLSKDEIILRPGDGKAVAAETVGSLSLVISNQLPSSFWGYALETAAKFLNIAPSKSVPQTPYEIWRGKPASYKYLRVWGGPAYVKRLVRDKLDLRSSLCSILEKRFPSDNRRDEVLIEESSEEPYHDSTTSFEPTIHTNGVPVLRRSTRESRVPERPTQGRKACRCKWIYKHKLGVDGEVTAFKARLVAKGYTQRPGVDFEETYSPVAMAKSIRILLAIAAWYDYEIWQMDVKTTFLNGFIEEEIFMDQSEVSLLLERNRRSVVSKGPSTASSKLPEAGTHILMKSNGVMISSRTTMILVYTRRSGSSFAYLVLYVDDILLIGNDVKMLGDIKA